MSKHKSRLNDPVWQAFQKPSRGIPITAEEERITARGIYEMNAGMFVNIDEVIANKK